MRFNLKKPGTEEYIELSVDDGELTNWWRVEEDNVNVDDKWVRKQYASDAAAGAAMVAAATKLIAKGWVKDGEPELPPPPRTNAQLRKMLKTGHETVRLSLDDATLISIWQLEKDNYVVDHETTRRGQGSPEKAQRALEREVAKRIADGFVELAKAPPRPTKPKGPSKAKPATIPKWVGAQPKLEKLAAKHGLAHRLPEILAKAKPAIDLVVGKATTSGSRLGGLPDLPVKLSWPAGLTFIAQLRCEDFAKLDVEDVLPAKGWLVFFAQLDFEQPEYLERGLWAHVPAGQTLVRTEGRTVVPKARALTGKLRLTLPTPSSLGLKLTDDESSAYHDELYLGMQGEEPRHQLFGWPSAETGFPAKKFTAQFDSSKLFEMGDYETLRFYGNKQVTTMEE